MADPLAENFFRRHLFAEEACEEVGVAAKFPFDMAAISAMIFLQAQSRSISIFIPGVASQRVLGSFGNLFSIPRFLRGRNNMTVNIYNWCRGLPVDTEIIYFTEVANG